MKNLYYKKSYHNFSDFSNDFLQENFYSSKIDYNLTNNESFFNNNAECYNCDAEFSSNNQLYIITWLNVNHLCFKLVTNI